MGDKLGACVHSAVQGCQAGLGFSADPSARRRVTLRPIWPGHQGASHGKQL